ncbi:MULTISPECIES: hypothetical protein [Subtercola]|uniref:hypothetical protein n=1 Tax=Subtercola TaxID=120212 RepID=UPI0010A9D302|nr:MULTISPECIES: hypothetical protein [Subtercola]MEA9984215.1 hypothetical protein [Subtercola sp. RTI3]
MNVRSAGFTPEITTMNAWLVEWGASSRRMPGMDMSGMMSQSIMTSQTAEITTIHTLLAGL